jgi:hypothetical protein
MKKTIIGDALITKEHRYWLSRIWNSKQPLILFIGLNPSRADHEKNDPTITRCINFAQHWKFGGLLFANLYSFRTPYPKTLIENIGLAANCLTDAHLKALIEKSHMHVCAWGSWNFINERAKQVLGMIKTPYCLGVNKDGNPKHPLYLKSTTELIYFNAQQYIQNTSIR